MVALAVGGGRGRVSCMRMVRNAQTSPAKWSLGVKRVGAWFRVRLV